MATTPRLRRRPGVQTWEVELFDVELDETSRAEMAADPSGFFRDALGSADIPINALLIDDRMINGVGEELAADVATAHILTPRSMRSKTMTIIVQATEEELIEPE